MVTRRRSPARMTVLVIGCALVLAACGADEPAPTGPTPPPGAAEAELVSLDALPDEVEAAIADAAARYDVPEDRVAVAGALRVVWADGSLGCPEPDTMYTQALVPGYVLTLEVDGLRVAYHGAEGEPPFLCER